MIRIIEQVLREPITGLSFIERYGGIAIPVTVTVNTDNGPIIKTMPVSCSVTDPACLETGKHSKLMPDSAYKSVSYLEEQGAAGVTFSGAKLNEVAGVSRVRLVSWLNMQKLGYDDCKGTTRFELEALNAIKGRREFSVDGISGTLDISRTSIIAKSPANIFGAYAYHTEDWAFFWPYDYFAVEFEARVMINAACLIPSEEQTPIECITNW